MLRVRLGIRLLQQIELELGREHRLQTRGAHAFDLRPQHLSGGGHDRRSVFPRDVAEDERRAFEPRDAPERRKVGKEVEVAVPALPARHRVAGLWIHVHVEGEQIVAAFEPVLGGLFEEVPAVLALADEPALHVGERGDDGVDRPVLDPGAQFVERQHRMKREPVATPAPPL